MTAGHRRAAKRTGPGPVAALALLAVGVLGSGVAWFFLVRAAIDFGRTARRGDELGWLFTAAAAVGAVGCLLLLFVLVSRGLVALGVTGGYRPRRSSGRRAAR